MLPRLLASSGKSFVDGSCSVQSEAPYLVVDSTANVSPIKTLPEALFKVCWYGARMWDGAVHCHIGECCHTVQDTTSNTLLRTYDL